MQNDTNTNNVMTDIILLFVCLTLSVERNKFNKTGTVICRFCCLREHLFHCTTKF